MFFNEEASHIDAGISPENLLKDKLSDSNDFTLPSVEGIVP